MPTKEKDAPAPPQMPVTDDRRPPPEPHPHQAELDREMAAEDSMVQMAQMGAVINHLRGRLMAKTQEVVELRAIIEDLQRIQIDT